MSSSTPGRDYDVAVLLPHVLAEKGESNSRLIARVIVTVTQDGKPVGNAAVLARPLDNQATHPFGVMTDPNGTAWFVFKEPGRYEIACGDVKAIFEAKRLRSDCKPGYDDVPRVSLPLK